MLNLKVGVMPGKLVEVVVEEGTSAREVFSVAGVEIANHEIRLDGNKIDLDTKVNSGNLLVAMKMIKGNMPSIKVGLMPGKLTTVEFNQGDSARQIFDLAREGKIEEAREIQHVTNDLISAILSNGLYSTLKELLKLNGVDAGYCRKPMALTTEDQVEEAKNIIDKYIKERELVNA